jgi:hypothetical protein
MSEGNPIPTCSCQVCALLREDTRPFILEARKELERIMNYPVPATSLYVRSVS